MSESIQKMREQRNELAREARNMLDSVSKEDWSKDTHGSKYDEVLNKIDTIDASIKRQQDLLDRTAEKEFSAMGGKFVGIDDAKAKMRAIDNKWFRGGDKALSAEDWAVKNTMSTTTPTEGGYTVQTEVASELIQSLKAFGPMRRLATIIPSSRGNNMSWPTSDNTDQEGEWVAQNTEANDLDPVFGTVGLNAHKLGSKVITVPIELLQDSQINIEKFVNDQLASRMGRTANKGYTIGTGTTQPDGIVTKAGDSGVSVNTTTGITYNKLLDLEHSVDPAYREMGAGWMFADSTLKLIRKLVDEQERPIFVPSYDRGIAQGAPAELMGRPIYINQNMAAFTGTNKFILFGLFSKYYIRDAMEVTYFRFSDSPYTKKGQVGFLAWARTGGNLTDTSAVKYAIATGS
jgi:HK97 family phage major capsid protein